MGVGKISKALNFLTAQLVIEKNQLICIRDTFKEVYKQEKVKRILVKVRSEKEYNEMVASIVKEEKIKKDILEQAQRIRIFITAGRLVAKFN